MKLIWPFPSSLPLFYDAARLNLVYVIFSRRRPHRQEQAPVYINCVCVLFRESAMEIFRSPSSRKYMDMKDSLLNINIRLDCIYKYI